MELLPGDRENLAIQTRGGPEKHEVTGWVLVSTLRMRTELHKQHSAVCKQLMNKEQYGRHMGTDRAFRGKQPV